MSEYIERKEAISMARYEFGNAGAKVMSRVPYAVNLIPVVFCKNCKHRFTSLCPTHSVEYDMENEAEIMWGIEEDDGFCSHGEAIK